MLEGKTDMMNEKTKRILGVPDEFWIAFVIMIGFFLKLVYDITTGYEVSTHDLGAWTELAAGGANGGHLGAIQYYFTYHHLPDFNPATMNCYSNPPLFYIISAFILEIIHRLLGWSIGTCLHFLQCINVIYVTVASFCGIGILRKFGVQGRKLVAAILFLTFFPAFYNLGATLNNDAMCFMFMMLTLNAAVGWYQTRKKKTIIFTAVWLGLGMMSKLNAVIIAPALAVLFISALLDKRTENRKLWNQYAFFAAVSIPLGLWWPVYNFIRFRMPFFYIQAISSDWQQLGGYYTAAERLAVPKIQLLLQLHLVADRSLEYNIWAQTFKSAIIDEQAINLSLTGTWIMTVMVLFMSIFLCVLFHVMWIRTLISNRLSLAFKLFTVTGYACILISYINFCFSYPVVCTMNFRYIPSILIFPLAGMALCGKGTAEDTKFERITSAAANWVILVFSVMTAFLFGFYAV